MAGLGVGTTRAVDDFADFDALLEKRNQRFDDSVETAFRSFDQKVAKAYERAGLEYEPIWGDVAKEYLPAAKYWVGYDESNESRIKFDYDKAEMTVEVLVEKDLSDKSGSKRIKDIVIKYAEMDSQEMNSIDPIRKNLNTGQVQSGSLKGQNDSVVSLLLGGGNVQKKKITEQLEDVLNVAVSNKSLQTAKLNKKKISLKFPFKGNIEEKMIQKLKPHVLAVAKKYRVSPALIFAIIKNESAFNPRAISRVPAYGLMQLVPSSGGLDAYNFVFGKNIKPKPDELFSSTFNITLGAAYLHILTYRYLKGVQTLGNRTLCVISAYNTGSGNVAKAFTGNLSVKRALPHINNLDTEALYSQLISDLPYEETRKYLRKVRISLRRYEKYSF